MCTYYKVYTLKHIYIYIYIWMFFRKCGFLWVFGTKATKNINSYFLLVKFRKITVKRRLLSFFFYLSFFIPRVLLSYLYL